MLSLLQGAWEAYRNRVIEEKLAKLGVERGSQSANPFITGHAQARATSVCTASPLCLSSPQPPPTYLSSHVFPSCLSSSLSFVCWRTRYHPQRTQPSFSSSSINFSRLRLSLSWLHLNRVTFHSQVRQEVCHATGIASQ